MYVGKKYIVGLDDYDRSRLSDIIVTTLAISEDDIRVGKALESLLVNTISGMVNYSLFMNIRSYEYITITEDYLVILEDMDRLGILSNSLDKHSYIEDLLELFTSSYIYRHIADYICEYVACDSDNDWDYFEVTYKSGYIEITNLGDYRVYEWHKIQEQRRDTSV